MQEEDVMDADHAGRGCHGCRKMMSQMQEEDVMDADHAGRGCHGCRKRMSWMQIMQEEDVMDAGRGCHGCRKRMSWMQEEGVMDAGRVSWMSFACTIYKTAEKKSNFYQFVYRIDAGLQCYLIDFARAVAKIPNHYYILSSKHSTGSI